MQDNTDQDIIRLLDESESIDAEEKQMWKEILPIMLPIHKQRLTDILLREKEKL